MYIAGIAVPISQSEEQLSGLRKPVRAAQPQAILEFGIIRGETAGQV
jgi:hypothetical protein